MAKESTESSVATSPSTPPNNWWDLHNHHHHHHHHHHASSLSSWTNNSSCSPWHPNSNNSSCDQEEVSISTSFTYASNQSGLTVESSHRLFETPATATAASNEMMGEHAPDNHHQLWSHVFLNDGSNGELHNTSHDVGENLLNPLSISKTISAGIFDPAYDYLKKMDTNWEFTNSPSSNYNNFEKHLHGITTTDHSCFSESERLNKLSNLVSHWSIAPPADPEIMSRHFNNNPQTCDISLSSSMADHHQYNSNISSGTNIRNSGLLSYYGHDLKTESDEHQDFDAPPAMASLFRKPLIHSNNDLGYNNVGFNSTTCSMVEADNKCYYGMPSHTQFSSARNFADAMTLSSRLTKPLIDIHVPKPYVNKSLNLSEGKKQWLRNSSQTRINGKERGGSNEGKKKRHEDTSEAVAKKPKTESSTASSAKGPKVKLADKITALQQIVSPFGKTDTASVLYEAIGYIKFLQEQVELLSNPYMKTNAHKDPWGSLERKDHKGDVKVDLVSRGLCLVPISCTPKVYHENAGSDYWTPAYRGCLYR